MLKARKLIRSQSYNVKSCLSCSLFGRLRDAHRSQGDWDRTVSGARIFGDTPSDHLIDGQRQRMAFLCETLGLTEPVPDDIHYQLLHRTASAVIEAQRFKTDMAAMVVHSFSPTRMWFDAFAKFVGLYGPGIEAGEFVEVALPSGMPLLLGWASGDPGFLNA